MKPNRRNQPFRSSKAPPSREELLKPDAFAINFFADAITALPRELVRHFTLLKEVDAKIFIPEAALVREVGEALESPLQEQEASQLPGSLNGSFIDAHGSSTASLSADSSAQFNSAMYNGKNLARRQKFRCLSVHLQDMLVSLDEKNHVISTAVEALNKQLARLDDCYPMISNEISEEARYGNPKHWAYEENRIGRTGAEKSRRDVAESTLSAAQTVAAEEIAARSETRKLAVQAKKGKNNQNESDFDDVHDGRRPEPTKKLHGNSRIRKAAEASTAIGLGITNGLPINGNAPSKRRKVDKASNNTVTGTLAHALGANGVAKGKAGSPRETPMPESRRKGKAVPTTNGTHSKKRNNTISVAQPPSLQSSPVHSTFAEAKLARASPVPTRPASGRVRQNSTHSLIDGLRPRPSSSASNKANNNVKGNFEPPNLTEPDQPVPQKEAEPVDAVPENANENIAVPPAADPSKDDQAQNEDAESSINPDSMQGVVLTNVNVMPVVATTTRAGRASKPSTPAIPTFPETIPGGRSGRSSRNQHEHPNISATNSTTSSSSVKRSHKKGAGAAAAAAAAAVAVAATAQQPTDKEQDADAPPEPAREDVPMPDAQDDAKPGADNDETLEAEPAEAADEVDEDEPTYCYCNNVSYGEMIGCDAEGCAREWFHLECIGLKMAPKNAKWYCEDCKDKMKHSKRGRSAA